MIDLVEAAEEEILDVFNIHGSYFGGEEIRIEFINDMFGGLSEDDVLYLDEDKHYESIKVAYLVEDYCDENNKEQLYYQLYVDWALVYKSTLPSALR